MGHLRQARDYIRSNARQPIQFDEVSSALEMSQRGVEVMFHESLGIGPAVYIRHRRLHGVRRELLDAEPVWGAVKELALNWGF